MLVFQGATPTEGATASAAYIINPSPRSNGRRTESWREVLTQAATPGRSIEVLFSGEAPEAPCEMEVHLSGLWTLDFLARHLSRPSPWDPPR